MSELEELDFLIEYQTKLKEFHDAKQSGDEARWRAAKEDMREYRRFWRSIRDCVGTVAADGDAVAAPAALGIKLEAN
jgi:hypothetical protein